MKKFAMFVLGFSGWVLAACLYNIPKAPVEYREELYALFAEAMMHNEGRPARIVRWNEGTYARFQSGAEIVHVHYGPVSKIFDPPKDWCYNETVVYEGRIIQHHCPSYGVSAGRSVDSFSHLPWAVQNVLLKGRRLAEDKWGSK